MFKCRLLLITFVLLFSNSFDVLDRTVIFGFCFAIIGICFELMWIRTISTLFVFLLLFKLIDSVFCVVLISSLVIFMAFLVDEKGWAWMKLFVPGMLWFGYITCIVMLLFAGLHLPCESAEYSVRNNIVYLSVCLGSMVVEKYFGICEIGRIGKIMLMAWMIDKQEGFDFVRDSVVIVCFGFFVVAVVDDVIGLLVTYII